ncbi:hypothetical protein [Bacillus sp. B15-48]|uniref:hypothetical protein n=1 Tax=Bacillus sp. B15-48 TaxID=1548601 RepID=UPI00193ED70F|nr:hypothetical protein [Bacillus sp. B15-48]MBM4764860.1 hypothetical protein [Bacillus sp. B15-48]
MIRNMFQIILLIAFIPMFIFMYFMLVFSPFMAVSEIAAIINYEAPKDNVYFVLLFFISLIMYLSVRIQSFRKIYERYPVLWPLSQMIFISLVGLAFGMFFMNLWAENEVISKPVAIILTMISFVLARVFMSYWYEKYPISTKMFK